MLPIKINRRKYLLPQRWGECTLEQFLRLPSGSTTPSDVVRLLLNLDAPVQLDVYTAVLMQWVTEPLNTDDFVPDAGIDILRCTYGQKIEACQLLEKDGSLNSAAALIRIYFPDMQPETMQLDSVLPIYLGLVEQIKHILNVEKHNLSRPPKPEHIRAGISAFEELGYFNQIDDLADGDPTKYDAILQLEYIVAYNKLRRNVISATFTERLEAIYRQQK